MTTLTEMGVLADLQERMVKAKSELDALANRHAAMHNMNEYVRVSGKSEGIGVALTYLDEVARGFGIEDRKQVVAIMEAHVHDAEA